MKYQVRKFPGINEDNGHNTMTPDEVARFLYHLPPEQRPCINDDCPITIEDLFSKLKGYLPNCTFDSFFNAYASNELPIWANQIIKPAEKG